MQQRQQQYSYLCHRLSAAVTSIEIDPVDFRLDTTGLCLARIGAFAISRMKPTNYWLFVDEPQSDDKEYDSTKCGAVGHHRRVSPGPIRGSDGQIDANDL